MIYIQYPHPVLNQSDTIKNWIEKRDQSGTVDKKDLWDWLGEHTKCEWMGQSEIRQSNNPKCWFTEIPIHYERHNRDVDHFRPENEATPLTGVKSKRVEAILGYSVPQRSETDPGYHWLADQSENYRLSNPGPNRTGAKGSIFPILIDTERMTEQDGNSTDQEFPLLLDPTISGEPECLLVEPTGTIIPAYSNEGGSDTFDFRANWGSPTSKHLRAVVSIVTYGLDDQLLTNARETIYQKTRDFIDTLIQTTSDKYRKGIKLALKEIKNLAIGAAPHALAARSAILEEIRSKTDYPGSEIIRTYLSELLNYIIQKEGGQSLIPK